MKTILSIFILMMFVMPAKADDQTWKVNCQEGTNKCQMSQRLITAEAGERIIEFIILNDDKTGKPKGVAVMPLGVYLPAGVILQVDAHKPFKFTYNYCSDAGCVCFIDIPPHLVDQMKKGKTASFKVVQINGDDLILDLSLKGFTKTYDELNFN